MQAKITIFTQPNCPKCPAAKELAREVTKMKGIELEEVDISTDAGMFEAVSHNVMTTPTLILKSKNQFEKLSIQDKSSLIAAIENLSM